MYADYVSPSDCIDEYKNDPHAFIFTLKNPHGVPPTRYMKRRESSYSLECAAEYGPDFCNTGYSDLLICKDRIRVECFIANNGTNGFECHPKYKVALFASDSQHSNEPTIYVSFLDYEVYCCQ